MLDETSRIRIRSLKKQLGDFSLDLSLELRSDEIFGVIGASGSGKTTLLRLLQGVINPDEGEICMPDRIATVFQDFNLLNNLKVYDNVALPLKIQHVPKSLRDEKIRKALSFVSLEHKAHMYPASLSGGEKQRICIARALVSEPQMLLCDEPTAALDKKNADELCKLFLEINRVYKTGIILVTHELDVARLICDRVAIIKEGKLVELIDRREQKAAMQTMVQDLDYTAYAREVLS